MKETVSAILEGDTCKKWFKHSMPMLESRLFYYAGVFVGWSLLHGGPGIPLLSQPLYKMMFDQNATLELDDIIDIEVQDKVRQVNKPWWFFPRCCHR